MRLPRYVQNAALQPHFVALPMAEPWQGVNWLRTSKQTLFKAGDKAGFIVFCGFYAETWLKPRNFGAKAGFMSRSS
jgi:hypothetical protein